MGNSAALVRGTDPAPLVVGLAPVCLMPRSLLYRIIIYVVALTVLVLGGTFLFGGFEGLSGHGVGALIAGVAVSLALGVGLMVLMYASSREHDEAAHRAAGEGLKNESDRKPEED